MSCDDVRTAISARLDGEDLPDMSVADVEAHLAGCPECRTFAADAAALHRSVRVTPAPEVPDLTPGILAAIGAEPERHVADRTPGMRLVLAVIGVIQLVAAVPALVLGDDAGLPAHDARHLGALGAALAIGFLLAAARPSLAAGLLPLVAAFDVLQLVTTVADVIAGSTNAGAETSHALELAGLLALYLVARATPSSARIALA